MKVAEKKRCIEPEHPRLSIGRQCELIGLARCSYYRASSNGQESLKNLEIMRRIDEEYTKHPFYGTRQMRNCLYRQGYKINRKRVQRLMRKMGLQSIAPKPNTSKPRHEHKVYPYLLGSIDVTFPNQVWCSDITYIPMASGFVYLTAVMDWHSRYVLSWEISVTMDSEFCVSALERALRCYDKPAIFNTDQGAQYTGNEFTCTLKAHDIKISMDGKGRAMDNIFIERLWRSVKYEEVYLNEYQCVEQLRKALKIYFEFYNYQRPHQSFNGQTPAEVYFNQVKVELAA